MATTTWIQSQLDTAEAASIPVIVKVANGETGNTNLIPVSQWQTRAQSHPNTFKGYNAAELHNGQHHPPVFNVYAVICGHHLIVRCLHKPR
ncbi:hypothetical protein [Kitasatospora sp. NPDC056531]|uniref:hypothetical protein n=1 Tax=Kitasatospora sp. NPDC056531 TaxID=3345856 RepID=UPI003694E79B